MQYCNGQWTSDMRERLIGVAIWERIPDCNGFDSAQRVVKCLLSGYHNVLVRSLYIGLLLLAEWMTRCMCRIILIQLLAIVPTPYGVVHPGSRRRRRQQSQRKDYKSHQSPNIYPTTLREVDLLNNNVREAPITTILYNNCLPAPRT